MATIFVARGSVAVISKAAIEAATTIYLESDAVLLAAPDAATTDEILELSEDARRTLATKPRGFIGGFRRWGT